MRMRIISGEFKGRYITTTQGNKPFRPTLERVRQSIAEIIKNRIEGALCADICAGSGAFGFEMLSRGAEYVDFVEKDVVRARLIDLNAVTLRCQDRCSVISREVRSFLKVFRKRYDIIYFDPPYDLPEYEDLVKNLITILSDDGVFIYEHRFDKKGDRNRLRDEMPFDKRDFGGTVVEFYRNTALPFCVL